MLLIYYFWLKYLIYLLNHIKIDFFDILASLKRPRGIYFYVTREVNFFSILVCDVD